jgi:hypothetical protein
MLAAFVHRGNGHLLLMTVEGTPRSCGRFRFRTTGWLAASCGQGGSAVRGLSGSQLVGLPGPRLLLPCTVVLVLMTAHPSAGGGPCPYPRGRRSDNPEPLPLDVDGLSPKTVGFRDGAGLDRISRAKVYCMQENGQSLSRRVILSGDRVFE